MKRPSSIVIVLALACATGCSSLSQVPRSEFAAEPERKGVLVRTVEGEQYAFDRVTISADSLSGVGFQQRTIYLSDGQASIEEVSVPVRLPLDRIATLSEKRRDWGRTAKWGLGAAAAAAFVVAVGTNSTDDAAAEPGGGKGPGPEL